MKPLVNILLHLLVYCCCITPIYSQENTAQDTVVVTIESAEQRFVSKNLTILINRFNIDIARDNMLQARLWYNPNLNYGTTLYNVETHKFFDDYYATSNYSDENFQVQQLITLAGRHHATWKLAEVAIKQAHFQLADLIRNLKYELHTDISDLYYNQSLIAMYKHEETLLAHLIDVTKELYNHGNAAGNDVVQLQAQLQDVVNQEISSQQSILSDEQDLTILLRYNFNTHYKVDHLQALPLDLSLLPNYQSVVDSAEKNRPDLQLSYAGTEFAEKNLKLQYTTALPDMTVGSSVSGTNSSGAVGYIGMFASMDIPVFNRNQWNIIAAKDGLSQASINDTLTLSTIRNEVTNAYCNLLLTNKNLNNINNTYGDRYELDLDEMMSNAKENYIAQRINLLSLLSIVNTYIDGKTNLLNLKVKYFNAIKNVNLNTGIELIK